jgi:predicted nucleic acid-binding protein
VRVFLDANILFSAARSDGAVRQLLRITMTAGHECWVDPYVVAEARRNLEVKAPDSDIVLDRMLSKCLTGAFLPMDSDMNTVLGTLPVDDRPVLAAAIRLRCDVLITGDKRHFGMLYGRRIRGVTVHSPASFFSSVLSGRK